jgi:predicted amidophosphoribosyltransferase
MVHLKTVDIVSDLVSSSIGICSDCKQPINLLQGRYSECADCGARYHDHCDRCACDEAEAVVLVTVTNCFYIGSLNRGDYTWN